MTTKIPPSVNWSLSDGMNYINFRKLNNYKVKNIPYNNSRVKYRSQYRRDRYCKPKVKKSGG